MDKEKNEINPEALIHILLNENEILKLQMRALVDVLLKHEIISNEDYTESMNQLLYKADFGANIQSILDDTSLFEEN
ncbi:hypothetical protein ACF3OH_11860 [Chryseomicrobium aureum]|uniref:hypothetical protein n=1 Tax=Chryseomicrobium aureum TaxID=1441723 RepID=UPI00370D7938